LFSTKRLNEKRSVSAALALAWLTCAPGAASADPCRTGAAQPVQGAAVNARREVVLEDGRLVRLAGLEATHPAGGDPALLSSANADLSQWALGAPLELIVLRAGADRWGRLGGRLFLAGAESAGLPSLAQALVEAGHARVDPAGEVRACLDALYGAEARARATRRGLWGDPAYAVLEASAPDSFAGRVGEVVVLQGVVASFGASRGRTYLNLGAGGRGAPALSLSRAQVRAFERIGQSPAALVGRTIRVRGLLDMRPGPRIQIAGPEAVELVDGIAAPLRRPR
jgi:endonuclease YncB( thermonuclease family)